ncbi:maleylpyruvate isomerase N-terminal domain-containing protein [Streptomyces sp. NPDC058686]|uniref:maleylpyruvate isomerase N-terminal domain-containing protein n=1 Tax=Streptomyces sp. NPDC058686 TaxID=3346599 RepID=UPI0036666444
MGRHTPPAKSVSKGARCTPREREAPLAWLTASTQQLLDALREAGQDRGCWTCWGTSQSPQTAGAVARHQLQEISLHTYDAQIAMGTPQPLPDEVALDGVDEFLFTCSATTSPWPHKPGAVDRHAAAGRSWRLSVSAGGARITRLPTPGTMPATTAGEGPDAADASLRGTASAPVLALHGRTPMDSLKLEGDRHLVHLRHAWDPDKEDAAMRHIHGASGAGKAARLRVLQPAWRIRKRSGFAGSRSTT